MCIKFTAMINHVLIAFSRGTAPVSQRSWVRILFRPEVFHFTTAQVVRMTAMINHVFMSFSAVQTYDLSYIHLYSSPSTGILRTHNVASSQLAG